MEEFSSVQLGCFAHAQLSTRTCMTPRTRVYNIRKDELCDGAVGSFHSPETTSDEAVDDPIPTEREDGDGAVADNSPTNGSSADAGPSDSAVESDAVSEKKLAREAATTAPPVENKTPDGKKESGGHVASHSSKQLAGPAS